MKKISIIASLLVILSSCKNKEAKTETVLGDSYEIIVSVKDIPNGVRAYLKNAENPRNPIATDSTIIRNNQAIFIGSIEGKQPRQLFINSVNGSLPIIIENNKIEIDIDKQNILQSKISGSKTNDDLYSFINKRNVMSDRLRDLTNQRRNFNKTADPVGYERLNKTIRQSSDSIKNYAFQFIKENPKSDFSLILLASQVGGIVKEPQMFEEALKDLNSIVDKDSSTRELTKKVTDFIEAAKAKNSLDIGKIAPKFSAPDKDGNMLALDDLMGKVTIIDFWAAWCGPCRRENPNVVKVYEKYHDKGLEIIGVSLDGNRRQQDPKAAWLKAIEDDNLTWHHVSSLQYFNDPVAKLYSVNSIPRTFILDEKGKIVAKNLRGQALEDKIAELLN